MKTNEDSVPWDPQQEDQRVDGKNLKAGVDQLERDTLRFLELIPDVKMADVRITTNVAFPFAQESTDRALTNEDFKPHNAGSLLEKLGVPKEFLKLPQRSTEKPTAESEETFKKIICRYLGAHANVPTKVSMAEGLETLELAVKGTEGGFTADSLPREEEEVENMRKAVTRDPRMKEIRRAVLVPKFGKTFQNQNPNIPLKDLKSDKERFLKQLSTKSFPLFGLPVIKAVIGAADNEVAHQGAEAITEVLAKEKYLFYDENGELLDLRTKVDEFVQNCSDCSAVREIKNRVYGPDEGHLFQIPKSLEEEVLLFADRRHQGFAEAYSRVKSWADFPDLKRKVTHYQKKSLVKLPLQIRNHTAGCVECGKRTAQLLLSPQQREAISRRHHLKFILGHYGSGKVGYSYLKDVIMDCLIHLDPCLILFSDNSCQCDQQPRDGQVWEETEVLHLFVQEQQRSGTQGVGGEGRQCDISEPN